MGNALLEAVARMARHGGVPPPLSVEPLPGGGNNRVYRVDLASGAPLLLKQYFRSPGDPRDRLGAETAFLRCAWSEGIRCVPRPIAHDAAEGLALYEFIDGVHVGPGDVTRAHVVQSIDFFARLNAHKDRARAFALPLGSEACFSLADHAALITRRLERLGGLVASTPAHERAIAFVQERLWPRWRALAAEIAEAGGTGAIPEEDRCVSPSDFGFHNALVRPDGSIAFLDFEYAGWDDPAKVIGDFFSQPAVPVPLDFLGEFARAIVAATAAPALHLARAAVALPAYQIKWCCIMLNVFLPVESGRRQFARGGAAVAPAALDAQRARAQAALDRVDRLQAEAARQLKP